MPKSFSEFVCGLLLCVAFAAVFDLSIIMSFDKMAKNGGRVDKVHFLAGSKTKVWSV